MILGWVFEFLSVISVIEGLLIFVVNCSIKCHITAEINNLCYPDFDITRFMEFM